MNYRYNLIQFDNENDYNEFLFLLVSPDSRYYVLPGGYFSGKELKKMLSNYSLISNVVFSEDYVNDLAALCACFEAVISSIHRTVDKIFLGESSTWVADALVVIEQIQGLLRKYGEYLPSVNRIPLLMSGILRHMEHNDIYAYADHLLILQQYLCHNMEVLKQDWKSLRRAGCYGNAGDERASNSQNHCFG